LEKRVEIDGIMFAGRKNKDAPKWQIYDRTNKNDEVDPDFKDVVLKFNPAGGLKFLAEHVLKHEPDAHFGDIACNILPIEKGYIPFALGMSTPEDDWQVFDPQGKLLGQAWPAIIHHHIEHWATDEKARKYAKDDVKYTRMLDEYFEFPEPGDDDSILACMVAAVRWHGFIVDIEKAKVLLAKSRGVVAASPVNINKPRQVRRYIRECMDETETLLIDKSTKKANIETIRDEMQIYEEGEVCLKCLGTGDYEGKPCLRCSGEGILPLGPMPVSRRASKILAIKTASKEVELHAKLVAAGRFHASFNVIGTLSSRMSGGDGLNPQGIKRAKEVRQMFPLKWDGMALCGGDFDSFEVVLADAVFEDKNLRRELMNGKKIHAMMGVELFPEFDYDGILATKDGDPDLYSRGKQGVFALLYGGDHNTIHNKLSVPLKVAEEAFDNFQKRFPEIKRKRDEVFDQFQAMRQPGGIGSAVIWKDPDDYAETFLGFRRFFTLENNVTKVLFNLAQRPPRNWAKVKLDVVRSDRVQTAAGAVSSALYGAAFQLQAANTRAANNHLIQSPGAQITKEVQRKIWDLQPIGVSEWIVAPMNIHDEVLSVTRPDMQQKVAEVVTETVVSYRERVPLIAMKFGMNLANWGEKGSSAEVVHIFPNNEEFGDQVAEALDDQTAEGGGYDEWDAGLDGMTSDEMDELFV
jgi:hypothetical protein